MPWVPMACAYKLEKVQRRATKMIPQLAIQDVSYEERLSALSLPSLSHWRFRGDLICCIKFLTVTLFLIFQICTPFQPHLQGTPFQIV